MPRYLPQRGAKRKAPLAAPALHHDLAAMWTETYLETCCRAALHRVKLAGPVGRPDGLKDGPCLRRMEQAGLTRRQGDGRFVLTEAGYERHATEVANVPAYPG
jgi:hypothetical protein